MEKVFYPIYPEKMSLFATNPEFAAIEALLGKARLKNTKHGIGDDAFLAKIGKKVWAISTDSSLEGVHFRLDWQPPEQALEKAILSNLSDLNAMGANCRYLFLSLGVLPHWDKNIFKKLGARISRLEKKHGFQLAGGDTVLSPKAAFFSISVFGPVAKKPLLRSAAKPGHKIYVSGTLGNSAAGLWLLNRKTKNSNHSVFEKKCIRSHFLPSPPLKLGEVLSEFKSDVAGIDISDGLSSELGHLSAQSKVRLEIELEKVPCHQKLKTIVPHQWKNWVLHGGEEYQLLFCGNFSQKELIRLTKICPVREIGQVKAGKGVWLKKGQKLERLLANGYRHSNQSIEMPRFIMP